MAKLSRKKGITSQIFHIFIQDSSLTTGAGKTGLAYNTASLVARYINAGGTLSASITLEDITTLGTYQVPTSNAHMRFKEVSNADPSKGLYEIHVHNDWMNLSGGSLVIMLAGAANMAPVMLEIDLQADVNVTHWGGTAIVGGVAGVPTVNLSYIQSVQQSVTDLKNFADNGYDPVTYKVEGVKLADACTVNTDMRGTDNAALASVCTEARLAELDAANLPTDVGATALATAIWNAATITYGTAGSYGLLIETNLDAAVSSRSSHAAADVWAVATRLLTAGTNIILAKGVGLTGLNDIPAADVWAVATRAITDKAGFSLSAAGVDDVLDEVVENTLTLRQLLRLSFSALAGKCAGGGTASIKFRDHADSKDRITATVDATGNRTAVTLNVS